MARNNLTLVSGAARRLVFLLCAAALAACGGGRSTTPAPEAVFTSAAQTAEARSTQMFVASPTTDPASMVATIAAPTPTLGAVTPSAAASSAPPPAATSAGTTPAAPPAAATGDAATFVADVTIPDETVLAPGEAFEKVWRISNTGATTWSLAYSLLFIDGNVMGAETRIPIPQEVAPGGQVEISVPMVAPESPGGYTGYWKMTNAGGALFGFGPAGSEAIWVKITVAGGGDATTTPESGLSSGTSSAVSAASISVNNPAASGACPYTFNLTGLITLNKAATVTYVLEAGTAAGDTVRTPMPITSNLPQGVHPVVYELTMPEDFSGWARLHITAPVDLVSQPVNFSLTCG